MAGAARNHRLEWPETAWRCVVTLWLVAVAGVWFWVEGYAFQAYAPGPSYDHQSWPAESALRPANSRPTLLLFMHPRCPCTRASIRELERLLGGLGRPEFQPEIIILVSLPAESGEEWRRTDSVRQASGLPRAKVVYDPNGRETSRFGAVASGTVMLFGAGGEKLFAGGVTASRGHEGDNAGTDALQALLRGRKDLLVVSTPAFGCRLCIPDMEPE